MGIHRAGSRSRWQRLALAGLLLLSSLLATARINTGEPAPDFVLKTIDGHNIRLSEYRGKVVLLTFWASWCGRCIDQLKEISGLPERYAGAGLNVLTVALDEDAGKLRRTADYLPAGIPVLLDGNKAVARNYDPGTMPLTLVIDPLGNVRYVHQGFSKGDVDDYARELNELLAE